MSTKGFESLSIDPSGEVKVVEEEVEDKDKSEVVAEASEKAAGVPPVEKKVAKVDRRQKIAPKPKAEPGPGDVELTKEHIEAAREELWVEGKNGNQNPTAEEILSRARTGVFSTMPDREVAERAIDAVMADPQSTKEIVEKTNKALREVAVAAEENARKWEEVDRVEEIEQERKREEEERVWALNQAKAPKQYNEDIEVARRKQIERIEQARKREEMARIETIEQERKREEVERIKTLNAQKAKESKPKSFKEMILEGVKVSVPEAKAAVPDKKPEPAEAAAPAVNAEEPKKHRSLKDIIFGR